MTDIDILSALNNQLQDFLVVNPMDVAYPNVAYSPTRGTEYLEVDILPASTVSAAVGIGACTRNIGIYQILVRVAPKKSFSEVKPIVDNLKTYFKMGTSILYNGVSVRVTKFKVEPAMEDHGWFVQPISVYYRSDLENV